MPQTAKKWNPGHYVQMPMTTTEANLAARAATLRACIKGCMVPVKWKDFETAYGVYNTAPITAMFDILKAANKRMIILFCDIGFQSETQCVPTYMLNNPLYEGGQQTGTNNQGLPAGCEAKRWVPTVMDRIIAAHQALSEAFDADPMLEGVSTEESAVVAPNTRDYVDQLKRLGTAMAAAYPSTLANMWVNWRVSPYAQELLDHLTSVGVGYGGPDTVPPPFYTCQAYPYYPTHRGQTFHLMAVQATHLIWADTPITDGLLTLGQVFDFGVTDVNGIGATHLLWWWFQDSAAAYDIYDTMDLIEARGELINSAIPTNIQLPASGMGRMGKFGRVARANIDFIGGVDDASVQRFGSL